MPHKKDVGSLIVYTGPMFSDKTQSLTRTINRYSDVARPYRPLLINSAKDNRDSTNVISSHSSQYKGLGPNVDVISALTLSRVNVKAYTVIGIDEGNFFPDLYKYVKKWVGRGKHVVVAALDGSFQMKRFGQVRKLLPISDQFVKMHAVCCLCRDELIAAGITPTLQNLTPAPFTKKIGGDMSKIEDAGGADKYIPVCRKHHDDA